ncbi:MAG TPA: hypothetical protein VF893_06175 [Candidatus Bathyarchaeia archaeon]
MTKDRTATIITFLICFVLTISLVGAVINYSAALDQKDEAIGTLEATTISQNQEISDLNNTVKSYSGTIASQNQTIANLTRQIDSSNSQIQILNSQIATLQTQLDNSENQINNLTSQIAAIQTQLTNAATQISNLNSNVSALQNEVDELMKIIAAMNTSAQPTTLVFHASEKGEGYVWGRLPNVSYTYSQLANLNNGTYDILLLPEFEGNLNWTETYNWISTSFTGIPICLSVFEGGNERFPNPNVMLNSTQIQQAMSSCDVQAIRIAEIVSWYIEANQSFPVDYVKGILSFARENGLWVLWSEWKVGDDVFLQVENYISGFEDIVTVAFQTNSGDLEPASGFELVSNLFSHWGGSIQSWYWETRKLGKETEMPISLIVQHALEATNMGAEILQFEPYWYFFDNGEPNKNFKILMTTLT